MIRLDRLVRVVRVIKAVRVFRVVRVVSMVRVVRVVNVARMVRVRFRVSNTRNYTRLSFKEINLFFIAWIYQIQNQTFPSQKRDRRQQSDRFEGDILLGSSGSNPSMQSAHLADPNKMWPGGLVEYAFYRAMPM